jgi:hypothetical protein
VKRQYAGNDPGTGWKAELQIEDEGLVWNLFTRMTDPTFRWLSVKLAAVGKAPQKANYWLAWDRNKQRLISRNADLELLCESRNQLHELLIEVLKQRWISDGPKQ